MGALLCKTTPNNAMADRMCARRVKGAIGAGDTLLTAALIDQLADVAQATQALRAR